MFNEIKEFNITTGILVDRLSVYLADEDIPFDTRFEVWQQAPVELLKQEPYIMHLACEKLFGGGEISWYDDFDIYKYQTVNMRGLLDQLLDRVAEGEGEEITQEFVLAFKKEVVETGLGSFVFDW